MWVLEVTKVSANKRADYRGPSNLDILPAHSQGRSKKDNTLCGSRGLNGHSVAERYGMESRQHPFFSLLTHDTQCTAQ